MYSAIIQTF
jgi:hypothetical protein